MKYLYILLFALSWLSWGFLMYFLVLIIKGDELSDNFIFAALTFIPLYSLFFWNIVIWYKKDKRASAILLMVFFQTLSNLFYGFQVVRNKWVS